MVWSDVQGTEARDRAAWALVRRQHGVIARRQLLELGFSRRGIEHRLATGRLNPIRRGVYAAGRQEITRDGEWMAAVLSCGPDAVLSHDSAGAALGIRPDRGGWIEVSVPASGRPRQQGIRVHRRARLGTKDLATVRNIPVTGPTCTLIDLAARLGSDELEATINEADRLDLIDPETLRASLDDAARRPGVGVLRKTLDARTFTFPDSELERRFLTIVRERALPDPLMQQWVNDFRVDFYWPDLGLVVETDGLRYHRTPAAQARDRLRDQAHTAAGLTAVRFTRAQVRYQPDYVGKLLTTVAKRLA